MPIVPYKVMTKQYTLHIWDRAIARVRHEKCWIQNCSKSISSNTNSNCAMYSFTFCTYWHCKFFFPKPENILPNALRIESLTFTKVTQVPEEYLPPPHPGSLVHGHTWLFSTSTMAAQLHPGPLLLPYLSTNRPSPDTCASAWQNSFLHPTETGIFLVLDHPFN